MAKKSESKRAEKGLRSEMDSELARLDALIRDSRAALEGSKRAAPMNVVSATAVEKVVEKVIEKEVVKDVKELKKEVKSPSKYGPLAFYFLSSLICIGILAYLFGSWFSFVALFVFSMFLWWSSHQFHITRAGMIRSFITLGLFVVVLYFLHWIIYDTFTLLFCIIYALSFVIAGVLYLYHFKRELSEEIHRSFARTFLVVFYSHVLAFTAASLLAYLLPLFIVQDSFVSISYIVLAWTAPVILVYYFLTKFLYLRFFDRKHIRRDFLKALAHGVVYTVMFVVLVLLAYFLTAIQFVGMEREAYAEEFSSIFTTLPNVRAEVNSFTFSSDDPALLSFRVTQEIMLMSDDALANATALKKSFDDRAFSSNDYFSDSYFTVLAEQEKSLSRLVSSVSALDDLKSDLLREYARLKDLELKGQFDDGTTSIEEHGYALADYVDDLYFRYTEPSDISSLRKKLTDIDSYSALISDNGLLDFNLLSNPALGVFLPEDSRFSRRFFGMVYHTRVFRDLMLLVFDTSVVEAQHLFEPAPLRQLYLGRDSDESSESKILRNRILKSNSEAAAKLARGA
jgi:uncharacterized membrane protein YjjP (DUF1212 family)